MVDCEWHSADLSARLSLMLDASASATVEWLKRAGLSPGPLTIHISSVKLRTTVRAQGHSLDCRWWVG